MKGKSLVKRLGSILVLTVLCLGITGWQARREKVLTVGFFAGSYWDAPNGNCYAGIDETVKRFEATHPGVRVEYQSGILKRDYSEWLMGKMLLGEAPDVFMILPEDFGRLTALNALAPLDHRIAQDDEVSPTAFYPSTLKSGRAGTVQYALPYECVPTLMFVNTTLLEREGISRPDNDWTWDDFYRICRAVTRDTNGDAFVDQFGSFGYTWQNAMVANNAQLFNAEGTACSLADDNAQEAIAFVQKLDLLYGNAEITSRTFDEGHVAFRPFLFSDYRTYQPYPWRIKKYSSFAWDCIQMPRGPHGDNVSELSTVLMGINRSSRQQSLAFQFLKEMTCSSETQMMLYTASHGASALRTATESPQTQEILGQDTPGDSRLDMTLLADVMESSVASVRFPKYDQAMILADKLIGEVMAQDRTLTLQLMVAQRELNQFLKN